MITLERVVKALLGGIIYFSVHFPMAQQKIIKISGNYISWYILYIILIIYLALFIFIFANMILSKTPIWGYITTMVTLGILIVMYYYTRLYINNKYSIMANTISNDFDDKK